MPFPSRYYPGSYFPRTYFPGVGTIVARRTGGDRYIHHGQRRPEPFKLPTVPDLPSAVSGFSETGFNSLTLFISSRTTFRESASLLLSLSFIGSTTPWYRETNLTETMLTLGCNQSLWAKENSPINLDFFPSCILKHVVLPEDYASLTVPLMESGETIASRRHGHEQFSEHFTFNMEGFDFYEICESAVSPMDIYEVARVKISPQHSHIPDRSQLETIALAVLHMLEKEEYDASA